MKISDVKDLIKPAFMRFHCRHIDEIVQNNAYKWYRVLGNSLQGVTN